MTGTERSDKTIVRIKIDSSSSQKSIHMFFEPEETDAVLLAVDELMKELLGDDYNKED